MRNQEIAEEYRNKPCEICGALEGICGHHIKSFGSGGYDSHNNLLALCVAHHDEVHRAGLAPFVERYPKLRSVLKKKGWKLDKFSSKWFLEKQDSLF